MIHDLFSLCLRRKAGRSKEKVTGFKTGKHQTEGKNLYEEINEILVVFEDTEQ